jgi:hypothetical protein
MEIEDSGTKTSEDQHMWSRGLEETRAAENLRSIGQHRLGEAVSARGSGQLRCCPLASDEDCLTLTHPCKDRSKAGMVITSLAQRREWEAQKS